MPNPSQFISSDDIRSRFSNAMSIMYKNEVPAYGTLLDLVSKTNKHVLSENSALKDKLQKTDNLDRISEERHGAIRLGSAAELKMIARVFGVMGMEPVAYYDLTQANVPVHSTAFRAVKAENLSRSPFRVFTSLLRTELITDDALRQRTEDILNARDIFTPRLRELVDQAEQDGGLDDKDANEFIKQATYTFKWHEEAAVDKAFYEQLKDADPRAADVACFKGPHINHLTPRTLEIDQMHADMPAHGMNAKNVVEGPPPTHPILLRQTSFKALTEKVTFIGEEEGLHTARFGEIEQRGAALTRAGRALYDEILNEVRAEITPAPDGSNAAQYMNTLINKFKRFPNSHKDMREQGLAFFQYFITDKGRQDGLSSEDLQDLINDGLVDYTPITYEDFLPVSAAGIFASNASDKKREDSFQSSSQDNFERDLGRPVLSEFSLYEKMQDESLNAIIKQAA